MPSVRSTRDWLGLEGSSAVTRHRADPAAHPVRELRELADVCSRQTAGATIEDVVSPGWHRPIDRRQALEGRRVW